MLEQHRQDFEDLLILYAKVKSLVIKGEAQDVEQKSNIAVFNEMRATLDHVLQCIGDDFAKDPEGEDFRKNQIRKAKEHLIRAAYDSLDGIGITIRKRISDQLKGLNETLIASSFPKYYSECLPKIKELEEKITESRSNRDKGKNHEANIDQYECIIQDMEAVYYKIGLHLRYIAHYNELVSDDSEFTIKLKGISQDAIYKICPQEYKDYIIRTEELKRMLRQKTFEVEGDKEYYKFVDGITDIQNQITALFPDLYNFDKQNKKNHLKQYMIAVLSAIIGATIGAIITNILS